MYASNFLSQPQNLTIEVHYEESVYKQNFLHIMICHI